MRPVNLIPKEERLDAPKSLRSGPTAYIIVGALVAALLGVTALVTTGNRIGDLKGEVTQVEGEITAAQETAQELSAYTQFHSVREQRVATVTSLADSRFDWERVMRELALVLPSDVVLTALTASVNPGVAPAGGTSSTLRTAIPGPALSMSGCTSGPESVAAFLQVVKDVDGVTRVAVPNSSEGGGAAAETGSAGGTAGCDESGLSTQFEMVVAFDAAPLAALSTEVAPEVAPSSPESEATVEAGSEE
jgi:Tfp pilus assembly protein PilN